MSEMDPNTTVVLVDISAIGHAVWHTSDREANRDLISAKIASRVVDIARGFPFVAVCCDSGKSFRHDIDKNYKANRAERDAGLGFQLNKAIDRLKTDGFVVWKVENFEADDLICTAVRLANEAGLSTMIASSDKDLLQLVSETVVAKSLMDGSIVDAAAVETKFGVRPDQMRDFLTLMGDTSDNVPGANRIGKVIAAKLLKQFGTIESLYSHLNIAMEADQEAFPPEFVGDDAEFMAMCARVAKAVDLTPSVAKSLLEFQNQMPKTRSLISMRSDVPLSLDVLLAGRGTPTDTQTRQDIDDMPEQMELNDDLAGTTTGAPVATTPSVPVSRVAEAKTVAQAFVPGNSVAFEHAGYVGEPAAPTEAPKAAPAPSTALAKQDEVLVIEGEVVWERQLEPRNMKDAERMAVILDKSQLFLSSYGNAPAVMTAILAGRELGLTTMASLRGIHMIEGKAALSASLMVGLLLRSGVIDYFERESGDDKQCTFVGKRKGARSEQRITHTIDMAIRAGLVKPKSNWEKVPEQMLEARASARLARLLAPDILFGIYDETELTDAKESR
jgi:5'-3' exonuclease